MKVVGTSWVVGLGGMVLVGGALLGLAGCGEANEVSDGPLSTVSSAVTTQDATDASGKIKVRIKTCDWVSASTRNEAKCTKDDGWVMIGGGAEIQNNDSNGALLKASAPDQDSDTTWVARSSGPTHNLRAYVVALQLVGLTESQLQPAVRQTINSYDSATSVVDAELASSWGTSTFMVVGGGTIVLKSAVNPNDVFWPDGYLVNSRPSNSANEWHSTAKYQTGAAGMKIYTIAIQRCPAGWDACLIRGLRQQLSGSASGYATATMTTSSNAVMVGIGGEAAPNGVGTRYLADMIPLNGTTQGFTIRSKSFGGASTSPVRGSSWDLMINAAPYRNNAVHFSSGGMLINGGNGVMLKGRGAFDDSRRWSLQKATSASYYLRNGNPDAIANCAYATSADDDVHINSSCSGTSRQWEAVGSIGGTIQLRNVFRNKCIDTNNVPSDDTGNVKLKTCSPSDNQWMYLNSYGWPL